MIRRISAARVVSFAIAGGAALGLTTLPVGCSVKFGSASAADDAGASFLNNWEAGSSDDVTPGTDADASTSGGADAGTGALSHRHVGDSLQWAVVVLPSAPTCDYVYPAFTKSTESCLVVDRSTSRRADQSITQVL